VSDDLVDEFIIDGDESINRIVDDFTKRHPGLLKDLQSGTKLQIEP
jgi:hypothetical protein